MSTLPIVCEQAIFTSARGPTGEGYRIVAASKGLRADEKQKITRCSPSHESLCTPGDADASPIGAAFYPLPGGRLCVALSRHAGAEHTGRGGQRVYTHNLIVGTEAFEACGFNPFYFIRAMSQSAIEIQKLPTGGVIPALELLVEGAARNRIGAECTALLPPAVRLSAIQLLLESKPMVVDLPKDWLIWAEALLLSIPAPLRLQVSFAAGIRFSTGRGHTLHILRDEKNAVQGRVAAQGISFVGPKSSPCAVKSHWLSFVDRHWMSGDLSGLASRSSRKYEDCSALARERVAELFNAIDALPQTENTPLIDLVFRSINGSIVGVEGDIRREFRESACQQLHDRFSGAAWAQIKPIWLRLVEFWRNGGESAKFAQPLLNLALSAAMRSDPFMAAELALTVAQVSPAADRDAHESIMKQVVGRLASVTPDSSPDEAEKLAKIVTRFRAARPNCPLIAQLSDRLAPVHGIAQ